MLVDFLRKIPGYVSFEAVGGFPERFLNICRFSGIALWEVNNDGVKVAAFTSVSDYKKIRKAAHRSGMRVRISGKYGLPFFASKHKNRVGAAIGVVLVIVFLMLMSGMVWSVEIVGNDTVKAETLQGFLEENGVKVGARKSKIDTSAIEEAMLFEYRELNWVSLNIFGGKLLVEIKETLPAPEVPVPGEPVNLVATKDGIITLVMGHNGTNAVKAGQTVHKGDLLVAGLTVGTDGVERVTRASGKVFARTSGEITGNSQLKCERQLIAEQKTDYRPVLFGAAVPGKFKAGNSVESEYFGESYLKGGGGDLPFGVLWRTTPVCESQTVTLGENEAALAALLSCVKARRVYDCDLETEECTYTLVIKSGTVTVTALSIGIEDIATEKPFSADPPKEPESEDD